MYRITIMIFKKNICFVFLLFFSLSVFSKSFEGKKFVISSASPYSATISKFLFHQGANVVDMAVASAFALAVTHPYYVSLGSGGFALVKINSSVSALDFRETASYKMPYDFFIKNKKSSTQGAASVGVPGFVAGLYELHKKYGKLPWSRLVKPAILLAKNGFPVSGDWVEISSKKLALWQATNQQVFLKKGKSYQVNDILKQDKLVKALKYIQKYKKRSFYRGPIGQDIIDSVKKAKGLLTQEDFIKYKVRWLQPTVVNFKSYKVYSMPLPSSGGIILSRALKLIKYNKLHKYKLYSLKELHMLAEIMARAFRPRNLMGDPDFINIQASSLLLDKDIKKLSAGISLKRVKHLAPLKDVSTYKKESKETTHLSIVDSQGQAVSMTLTLNGFYGSGLISDKYGIVLNNQIDDFTSRPHQANLYQLLQGKNNMIQGGKRPLSSMTPTIVSHNKQTVLVLGGAGGPTIITAVLQSLYRHLIHKMPIEQAVQAPRLHHQFLPRQLKIENKRFNPGLISRLRQKGHKILLSNYLAQVFAVSRDPHSKRLFAAQENRREGAVGGL